MNNITGGRLLITIGKLKRCQSERFLQILISRKATCVVFINLGGLELFRVSLLYMLMSNGTREIIDQELTRNHSNGIFILSSTMRNGRSTAR